MTDNPTLQERKEAYLVRCEQYRRLEYDPEITARFVAGIAGPLTSPVLDVGSGKGSLSIALARLGVDVIGVDLDPEEQKLAASLAEDAGVAHLIQFLQGDAAQVPFPDDHFTGASMLDALHHLDEEESVLTEMMRVVRTGGFLVLSDFSEPGFKVVEQIHREEGGEHARTAATVGSAEAYLVEQGCELVARIEDFLHLVTVLRR
ncbi:class I SAM-dependent methyltransferase [Gemmatimonadota bacterium]